MLGAVCLNEFNKYQRIKSQDKELSAQYLQHSDNYRFLMQEYTNQMPKSTLLKYGFGIDIENIQG